MDYLDKQSLKPTKDAWKNGYHLSVKFGNIEIDSENTYNNENEKDVIFSKLDKMIQHFEHHLFTKNFLYSFSY